MRYIILKSLVDLKESASEEIKKEDEHQSFWETIQALCKSAIEKDLKSISLSPKQTLYLIVRLKAEHEIVDSRLITVNTSKAPYIVQYNRLSGYNRHLLKKYMSKIQIRNVKLAPKQYI